MHLLLKRIQSHNKIVKPLILFGFVTMIFFFSLFINDFEKKDSFDNEIKVIVNDSISLKTDVSSTSHERTIGLSKYEKLSEDQAMLFVFERKGLYSFWMRDMKFPIDIIWLDENKTIVSIKENADPIDFPQSYAPETEALYVLETVAGFIEKNNIQKGQNLIW